MTKQKELELTGALLEERIREANRALELAVAKVEALSSLLVAYRRIQQLDREEALTGAVQS